MSGWTIQLFTMPEGLLVATTTTNATGYYNFTNVEWGNYWVNETLQPGYINLSPASLYTPITATGWVRCCVNFTNQLPGFIEGYKKNEMGAGLPGWTITLAYRPSGLIVATTTTNASGYYNFTNVKYGSYYVNETVQDGYINISPTSRNITISSGIPIQTNIEFTNQKLSYCIDGFKYEGAEGAEPLEGWNITVTNTSSGSIVGWNWTNDSGYWKVCGLPNGTYQVCEVLKDGYVNLSELCQQIPITGDNVTADPFRNQVEEQTYCISGFKYNGTSDEGLPGWLITVKNETDVVVGTNTTNATGYWQVCGLPNGTYQVCETPKTGWVNLTELCTTATITGANNTTTVFRNQPEEQTYCISGYKIQSETGQGLGGWVITARNETGAIVGSNTTNSMGYWEVCGLSRGTYNISEDLKIGWVAVDPATGYQLVNLLDSSLINVNFTNDPNGSICGYKIDQGCSCGLKDWPVSLYNCTTGALVASTTTSTNGSYCFTGLNFGCYWVNETMLSGWTAISSPSVKVAISEQNPNVIDVNFTNALNTFCCSCPPNPKFTYTVNGRTVSFKDTSVGPKTIQWYWNFGDLAISTQQNPTHTYSKSGTYTVYLYIKWVDCSGKTSTSWKVTTNTVRVY
jgi:PKD repeat protein